MTAHDRTQPVGRQFERADVIAGLPLGLAADFSGAIDDDDGLQRRSLMAFLEPLNVMDDSGGPGFDAAEIAVYGLMLTDHCVRVIPGFLLGDEQSDVLLQRALVAFERQDIVGFLVNDLPGYRTLASHGIDGHDGRRR